MVIDSLELGNLSGHAAGRQLLGRMYHTCTGRAMPPILVADGGKPYFATGDVHFSISHTKQRVFCALSDRPVGIDAERIDRPINLNLAQKLLSPAEKQQYDEAEDKRLALLTFWVLKEAAAKKTGKGITFHPNDTDFSLTDPRVQILYNHLVAVIE